jgi:hypothetical protein
MCPAPGDQHAPRRWPPPSPIAPQVFLIYGRTGWIGGLVAEEMKRLGIKYEFGTSRLEDRSGILDDISRASLSWLP